MTAFWLTSAQVEASPMPSGPDFVAQVVSGPRRQAPMTSFTARRKMDRESLTVADIYCGAGGLSTGFATASACWNGAKGQSFDVVFGTDKDKQAMRTFRANHFPDLPFAQEDPRAFCGDVGLVSSERILEAIKPTDRIDV